MKLLRQRIEEITDKSPIRWGIVINRPATGQRLELNPSAVFPAASMIKVPIMYEVMRQAAAGILSLEDTVTVTRQAQAGGAGILAELRPGLALTVQELTTLMIVISDNTATNLLIDLAGMPAINTSLHNLGLHSTSLKRKMMDFPAARSGNENTTSAADMAALFGLIHAQACLPPHYCQLMLDILSRQQVRDKIPFYLPEEFRLAHKTGTLPGVEHDGGILFFPDDPCIVTILADNLDTNHQGLQLIAGIGKRIYDYFNLTKLPKGE